MRRSSQITALVTQRRSPQLARLDIILHLSVRSPLLGRPILILLLRARPDFYFAAEADAHCAAAVGACADVVAAELVCWAEGLEMWEGGCGCGVGLEGRGARCGED